MTYNDKLIFLTSTAQHLLKNHLILRFKQEGVDITPSHSTILFTLQIKGPLQMNDLSKIMHIENSTVTGLIDRMEKKGYVKRSPVENDRRKWSIEITQKGTREIDKAQKIIKNVNNEIKEGFSKEEIETYTRVLNSFFLKFTDHKEDIP